MSTLNTRSHCFTQGFVTPSWLAAPFIHSAVELRRTRAFTSLSG
ncbi:hypothetical protein [Microbacterium sp.]